MIAEIAKVRQRRVEKKIALEKDAEELKDQLVKSCFGRTHAPHVVDTDLERSNMLVPLCTACKLCRMCNLGWRKTLEGNSCDPHVFSNMNISRYVVVGQNPGMNEMKRGEPFVGASGMNFNDELQVNGHSRDEFYITNTVKCYTAGNQKPTRECINQCGAYLKLEFASLRPKLVVSLGAVAFERLCPGMKFSEYCGKIANSIEYGVKVFVVYHPSPMNLAVPARKKEFKHQIKLLCSLIDRLDIKPDQSDI
jgi:uracil-DNA glycosylase family 4